MLYSLASSVYSLFYTIISVSKDKTYHIINKETDETNDVDGDYVIIKRMRDKPLTESIYEHITAPFISATKIDNTIYLGNAFNAADYNYIKNNGITAIVNASKEISNYFETNSDLQYFKLDNKIIDYAAERNPKKYNLFTPGTKIKIISEKKSRGILPNYYLVLPWHFKKEILQREKKIMKSGTRLIFPLPKLEIR